MHSVVTNKKCKMAPFNLAHPVYAIIAHLCRIWCSESRRATLIIKTLITHYFRYRVVSSIHGVKKQTRLQRY